MAYLRVSILLRCFITVLALNTSLANNNALTPTQHLSIASGLSDDGVTCMLKDSRGFLWIGTYDGLNRYDGYQLKHYRNTIQKNILSSNRIRSIVEDQQGNFWIGTDAGITLYNSLNPQINNLVLKLDIFRFDWSIILPIFCNTLSFSTSIK